MQDAGGDSYHTILQESVRVRKGSKSPTALHYIIYLYFKRKPSVTWQIYTISLRRKRHSLPKTFSVLSSEHNLIFITKIRKTQSNCTKKALVKIPESFLSTSVNQQRKSTCFIITHSKTCSFCVGLSSHLKGRKVSVLPE